MFGVGVGGSCSIGDSRPHMRSPHPHGPHVLVDTCPVDPPLPRGLPIGSLVKSNTYDMKYTNNGHCIKARHRTYTSARPLCAAHAHVPRKGLLPTRWWAWRTAPAAHSAPTGKPFACWYNSLLKCCSCLFLQRASLPFTCLLLADTLTITDSLCHRTVKPYMAANTWIRTIDTPACATPTITIYRYRSRRRCRYSDHYHSPITPGIKVVEIICS